MRKFFLYLVMIFFILGCNERESLSDRPEGGRVDLFKSCLDDIDRYYDYIILSLEEVFDFNVDMFVGKLPAYINDSDIFLERINSCVRDFYSESNVEEDVKLRLKLAAIDITAFNGFSKAAYARLERSDSMTVLIDSRVLASLYLKKINKNNEEWMSKK